MQARPVIRGLAATAVAALACTWLSGALASGARAPAGVVSRDVAERQISIERLYLGLTPGGNVGVYMAYTPRYPRELTSVGVAIGASPRMVYGFYDGGQIIHSPLKQAFPNASGLVAGRSYRVKISFCRTKTPERARSSRRSGGASAHAAKVRVRSPHVHIAARQPASPLRASGLSAVARRRARGASCSRSRPAARRTAAGSPGRRPSMPVPERRLPPNGWRPTIAPVIARLT